MHRHFHQRGYIRSFVVFSCASLFIVPAASGCLMVPGCVLVFRIVAVSVTFTALGCVAVFGCVAVSGPLSPVVFGCVSGFNFHAVCVTFTVLGCVAVSGSLLVFGRAVAFLSHLCLHLFFSKPYIRLLKIYFFLSILIAMKTFIDLCLF